MKMSYAAALLIACASLNSNNLYAVASKASLRGDAAQETVNEASTVRQTEDLCKAGNGDPIPYPTSKKTYTVKDGSSTVAVPATMVYIPAGESMIGAGPSAQKMSLPSYCIGKFDVTNAEYKAFLVATGSSRYPRYWHNGTYPEGKASHPVVYVSLDDAKHYADWISKETGWTVSVPTSQQWEKAARGPKGSLYPWGDTTEVTYRDGVLTTRFNFNAVTASDYLKNHSGMPVTYDNPKSKYFGTKTTVEKIAGYDEDGLPTYLSVGANGSVRGWVSHPTYTGFIYTDLFTALNDKGGNTSAVGAYEAGKSVYGAYDMAGNVWNWCDTQIAATNGAEKGKTVNEIRGGSWYATSNSCKSVSIGEGRSGRGEYNTVGFRIVASVPKIRL